VGSVLVRALKNGISVRCEGFNAFDYDFGTYLWPRATGGF